MKTHHSITEFGTIIPQKLTIPANSKKIMVANTINTADIVLEENSQLTLVSLVSKGWKEKQIINFWLDGKGAYLTFVALILGKDKENFPFETVSNHQTPNTEAYYHVRSAMNDHSQIYYKGNLVIDRPAQLTNCHLSHDTLMLSKHAKVETIPSLEIQADDVKAGHAATVGKIEPELLFYFQSRGINEKDASHLLTKAFMSTDLKAIPDEEVRKYLDTSLDDLISGNHV